MFIDPIGNLYAGDMRVSDREATAEEIAAWSSSKPPAAVERIRALEREQLLPRAVREFMLLFMQANFTDVQLTANPGYSAVKAFDDHIVSLRASL